VVAQICRQLNVLERDVWISCRFFYRSLAFISFIMSARNVSEGIFFDVFAFTAENDLARSKERSDGNESLIWAAIVVELWFSFPSRTNVRMEKQRQAETQAEGSRKVDDEKRDGSIHSIRVRDAAKESREIRLTSRLTLRSIRLLFVSPNTPFARAFGSNGYEYRISKCDRLKQPICPSYFIATALFPLFPKRPFIARVIARARDITSRGTREMMT